MLRKRMIWAMAIVFLFPVSGYADTVTVPDFKSPQECRDWVHDYEEQLQLDISIDYDRKFDIWLSDFSKSWCGGGTSITCFDDDCIRITCVDGNVSEPCGGGCAMVGDPLFEDVWTMAERNLRDAIDLYEKKLEMLPSYFYGKEWEYRKGTDYQKGTSLILMHDDYQPCATLNAENSRLHIPCLKDGGKLYWKEWDQIGLWKFEISNVGAGFVVRGYEDYCATYTASTGIIHIPCVKIGDKPYWADFEVMNTDPIQIQLKNHGVN